MKPRQLLTTNQTRKQKKEGEICIYIHKQLEFTLRNDIDIFNVEIETCFFFKKTVNKRSRNFIITGVQRSPKRDIKVVKNYCKDFLKIKKWKQ